MADVAQQNPESDDRPLIELFVKAGVDHMKNGGCPMCHRYFMIFYILREHGLIDLVVTTFRPHDLPPEVKSFSSAKQFPLVKVHRGVDSNGVSLIDTTCDTVPEIEDLLERFDCDDVFSVKQSAKEAQAEKIFEDLYRKFKSFLSNQLKEQSLTNILEKIDEHLKANGTKFLLKDTLTRADCYLLPTLQHLRVAGKFFKDFEIPTEYEYLWRFLGSAYDTEAMHQSTPADREIIFHYEGKVRGKNTTHASLMKDARTFSVPTASGATVIAATNGGHSAGDRSSTASSEPEPAVQAAPLNESEPTQESAPVETESAPTPPPQDSVNDSEEHGENDAAEPRETEGQVAEDGD